MCSLPVGLVAIAFDVHTWGDNLRLSGIIVWIAFSKVFVPQAGSAMIGLCLIYRESLLLLFRKLLLLLLSLLFFVDADIATAGAGVFGARIAEVANFLCLVNNLWDDTLFFYF